jgi:hypothetical protein
MKSKVKASAKQAGKSQGKKRVIASGKGKAKQVTQDLERAFEQVQRGVRAVAVELSHARPEPVGAGYSARHAYTRPFAG